MDAWFINDIIKYIAIIYKYQAVIFLKLYIINADKKVFTITGAHEVKNICKCRFILFPLGINWTDPNSFSLRNVNNLILLTFAPNI